MSRRAVPGQRTRRAVLLLALALAVPAFRASAQAAAGTQAALEMKEALAGIEDLLARGVSPSDAEVAAAERLMERARDEGTRSLRTRGALVAYLARETAAQTASASSAEERARLAASLERARRRTASARQARRVGFRISVGACALTLGAYNAFGYLAEEAFNRFARSATAVEAESARALAASYGMATAAAAGAFVVALASLLATAGAGLTSLP